MLEEPVEVSLGSQSMKVNGFKTWLSPQELREFYTKALPQQGWTVTPVPWIAQTEQAVGKLDAYQRAHPDDISHDATAQANIARVNAERPRLQAVKQGLLYAVRRDERLLLNIDSAEGEAKKTRVAVNRWKESAAAGQAGISERSLSAPASQGGFLSKSSPCCTGEAVPQSQRKLPGSIPAYPNARVVLSGGSPSTDMNQTTITEFALTEDSMDQVTEYYQHQMAYNGWSLHELPAGTASTVREHLGSEGAGLLNKMKSLLFENNGARCTVVVAEGSPDALSQLNGSPTGMTSKAGSSSGLSLKEHTFIVISYFKSDTVTDLLHKVGSAGGRAYGR